MHVEYVAHSGSDLLVVDAARASFGKQSEWEQDSTFAKVLSERDKKLISYLAREKHVLPFRHPTITLRCKAPIFVARQLMKHQAGMSWSEESRRYITTEPEFYFPDKWRKKADNVKQGSSDEEHDGYITHAVFTVDEHAKWLTSTAVGVYRTLLDAGVAPEQARTVLPQNMYTTFVWTGTLLAWIHMLKLRLDSHSQKEVQEFAGMVRDVIEPLYPVSYAALMKEFNDSN